MATTTTLNHTIGSTYTQAAGTSISTGFINWCKGQQKNRLIWLGVAVAAHGCVITPLTVFAVTMAGNSLVLFMLAIFAMAISLVTNLAALPTKITIPAFALSILIDIGILISAALMSLHII